jgi:Sigma-70 region 2
MTVTCTRMGWVAALRTQRAAPSSDEMLIRRIAEGDQLAMRTLFGRHRVPLYRWLLRLVGDDALAEDLLSDVFLDIWRQAAAFEARSSGFDLAAGDCALQGALGAPPPDGCGIG